MTSALVPLHAEPWAPEIVDLESLNAAAANAVTESIEKLRQSARAGQRTVAPPALVAVGPAGVGKTHLFGRLRRKIGARGVFVHIRPLLGAAMTTRHLLGQVVQQLGYSSYGQSQIDVIAGTAIALAEGENPKYPSAMLQGLRELSDDDRQKRVEHAIEAIAAQSPDIDTPYLEQLLRVPFADRLLRTALLLWLSGRELDEAQARRVGLRESLPEDLATAALRTLAVVASTTAPLVIVFDQLENLADPDGSGSRVIAYGNLISDLVDVVRDVVIVQMGLATEWDQNIERRLGPSQRSRVVGRRIPLALPTPAERRALLTLWIKNLPAQAPPPWPFTGPQLEEICNTPGFTPRMLLFELQNVLEGRDLATTVPAARAEPPDDAILAAWGARLANARRQLDEMADARQGAEPAFLMEGFVALTHLVPELGAIAAESPNLARLENPRGPAWIAHIHQANPSSVRSALRALADRPGGLLAVRESWREWPPTWRATREQWDSFRKHPAIQWLWLDRDEVTKLLALATLLKDARSADVSGVEGKPLQLDAVIAWARARLDARNWLVTQSLLGKRTAASADELPAPRPAASANQPDGAGAIAILRTLRVASLERIVRETARAVPGSTRASVLEQLRASGNVHWIGDAIARWTE